MIAENQVTRFSLQFSCNKLVAILTSWHYFDNNLTEIFLVGRSDYAIGLPSYFRLKLSHVPRAIPQTRNKGSTFFPSQYRKQMLINSDIVCTDPRSVPVRGSHEHRNLEHSLVKGNNLTKPDPLTNRYFCTNNNKLKARTAIQKINSRELKQSENVAYFSIR